MCLKNYRCIAFEPSYNLKNIPSHTSLISQSQTNHPYTCIKKTEYAVRIRNAGKTGIFGAMLATPQKKHISKEKKKKKKGEPIKFNSYSNNVKTLDFPKPARVFQVKICRVGQSERKINNKKLTLSAKLAVQVFLYISTPPPLRSFYIK